MASFVSGSSIFMFVLHILVNDFLCLSHRLMYKSDTSATEVIQRKSACSYLCLPNSCFNFSVSSCVSGELQLLRSFYCSFSYSPLVLDVIFNFCSCTPSVRLSGAGGCVCICVINFKICVRLLSTES